MISSKIIVALDFSDSKSALALAERLDPTSCRLKVGKELFTACGPAIVQQLHALGFALFLDLKFHDIPNTVYKAIRVAADLGVWMVNVHASGGREMLEQAVQALGDSQHKPLLIAVTILTSLSSTAVAEIGYKFPLSQQVEHLAKLAYSCGVDGVVCSAFEALAIKQCTQPRFISVTPGIRLAATKTDDQTRIMTPQQALANGADYLVIGRPVSQAADPAELVNTINRSLLNS